MASGSDEHPSRVLKPGDSGADVDFLRAAVNNRLEARGLGQFMVPEKDGLPVDNALVLGCRKAAWALGALLTTVESLKPGTSISVGVQDMIRHPSARVPAQLDRAKDRAAEIKAAADRKPKQPASGSPRGRAIKLAQSYAGKVTENPAGSNRGGMITKWQCPTPRSASHPSREPVG